MTIELIFPSQFTTRQPHSGSLTAYDIALF